MTALATAASVLAWAADPAGSPPVGDLTDAAALTAPGNGVLDRLRQVAARTAAVLGAGVPPFGDGGPVGLGAVLLAAAVGGRQRPDAARAVAKAVPLLALTAGEPAGAAPAMPGWADAVARHGVLAVLTAERGQPVTGDGLTEALLAASPLSAVLLRPPSAPVLAESGADPLADAAALLARPRGLAVLTTAFAAPVRDPVVLTWRARVLTESPAVSREALLGVYLAARLRHGDGWDDLIGQVRRGGGIAGFTLREAVIRFWAPLAALDRADRDLLPSQPFLEGYRAALNLVGGYEAPVG